MQEHEREAAVKKFFENDRFVAHSGIRLVEAKPGYAVSRLDIGERHLNAAGVVQGGAIYTLADFAFAAASNAKGSLTLSVNASIQYFKPPSGAFITATAREVSASRRLCSYAVEVRDEDGSLVALYNGTGYIKGSPLEFGG